MNKLVTLASGVSALALGVAGLGVGTAQAGGGGPKDFKGTFEAPMLDSAGSEVGEGKMDDEEYKVEVDFVSNGSSNTIHFDVCLAYDDDLTTGGTTVTFLEQAWIPPGGTELKATGAHGVTQPLYAPEFRVQEDTATTCEGDIVFRSGVFASD
jgi:hypothetical protein